MRKHSRVYLSQYINIARYLNKDDRKRMGFAQMYFFLNTLRIIQRNVLQKVMLIGTRNRLTNTKQWYTAIADEPVVAQKQQQQ